MVCVSFCVICIVERLVSSVICRFQGLSYLHVPDCIRVFFYFVNSSHYYSAWNGRPWPGRSQNWMLMYFIINLSGSQQFSGSSIQNQVELSKWATGRFMHCYYIWHCVPNILLWSILCKTVGLPSSTGESERTARRQLHSPTLRCFRGHLCEVAAGRRPLKQSRWAESNWTLPLRSVGVAPSLGRFWLVFAALKLRYVLRRHIILSDSDGNQAVLDCFTVSPGLGGSAK